MGAPSTLMSRIKDAGRVLSQGMPKLRITRRHRETRDSFEGAQTDRLNSAHWVHADARDINALLTGELVTLRNRCRYEARNNTFARGIMETYSAFVIGADGPALQVDSDKPKFTEAVERNWRKFCDDPDTARSQSLADIAQMCIKNMWCDGEFFIQHYLSADGVRINDIDPSRIGEMLGTRFDSTDGTHVIMGVERTKYGKARRYWVQDVSYGPWGASVSSNYTAVKAEFMIHGKQDWYTDQVRGIPWLTPALETCGHAREYDAAVLEAAKTAAKLSALLFNRGGDGDAVTAPEIWEIQRGEAVTMPSGWEVEQLDPKQPSVTYREFHNEQLRRMGRMKGVPLMLVRLDAGDHNYSSARFDGQMCQIHVRADQAWMRRKFYEPLLADVARFTSVSEFGGQEIPYEARWIFPSIPHVDPLKEAMAERIRLENGTLTDSMALAAYGLDFDAVVAQRKREMESKITAKLPLGASAGKIASEVEATAIVTELMGEPDQKGNGNASAKAA